MEACLGYLGEVGLGLLESALRELASVTSACMSEKRDKLGMMVKSGQGFL